MPLPKAPDDKVADPPLRTVGLSTIPPESTTRWLPLLTMSADLVTPEETVIVVMGWIPSGSATKLRQRHDTRPLQASDVDR
jgi:hypothetical protein